MGSPSGTWNDPCKWSFKPFSPKSNQHQFSPNNITTSSRERVMRFEKMITRGRNTVLLFFRILSTNSLGKCMGSSLWRIFMGISTIWTLRIKLSPLGEFQLWRVRTTFHALPFLPPLEISRRHPSSSRVYIEKFLQFKYTVSKPGDYDARKNLDFLDQGPHGIFGWWWRFYRSRLQVRDGWDDIKQKIPEETT